MIKLFYGPNIYGLRLKLNELKQQFTDQYGEEGVELHQVESLDADKLRALLVGVSLFATNRLIVIYNLSQDNLLSDLLQELAVKIPDSTKLILIEQKIDKRTSLYKYLKKSAELEEFLQLSDSQLTIWLKKYAAQLGGNIEEVEAKLLLRYVGIDQQKLASELQKLILFDKIVTKDTIKLLVEKQLEATVFDLLEAVLRGESGQALSILNKLESSHEDPFALINMLIWQIHVVAIVHVNKGHDMKFVAHQHKLNPYVLKKTHQLTQRLTPVKIKQLVEKMCQLDIKIKSTAIDPWRLIEATLIAL